MSSRAGTIQAPKVGRSMIWPAAFLTAVVILAIAIASVATGRDEGTRPAPVVGVAEVSGTLANTPSEISGGIVGSPARTVGTAANTPTELTGGIVAGTYDTTPEALTAAERYDLHQRI